MVWVLYGLIVLALSGAAGFHLGRFREAYTEMTGMMAGMAMGMLNGFLLGYAAAAVAGGLVGVTATVSLFWGNLIGILLGALLGIYFGRAGGLMGMMDGGMGGVMGGSMGAMLAAMLTFPEWVLFGTGMLLLLVYVVSMVALIVLIEKSAPGHAALHRFAPYFTRAVEAELRETLAAENSASSYTDYYALLGVAANATSEQIASAYIETVRTASVEDAERAERALILLTDPARRAVYDRGLAARAQAARGEAHHRTRRKVSAAHSASAGGVATSKRAGKSSAAATRGRREPRKGSGAGPLIGGGIGMLLVFVVLAWLVLAGTGGGSPAGDTGFTALTDTGLAIPTEQIQKLERQAIVPSLGAGGAQSLDYSVNGDTRSYTPYVVKVKKGLPVHFNLSMEGTDPG